MSNGLKSLFDLFIKEKRYLENRSEETIKSYKLVYWRYEKYSDTSTLLTDELLSSFVMGMREGGLFPTTCNISIRSFNSFLSWLHAKGHIENLRLKKVKETERVRKTPRDERVRAVLNWKPKTRAEHRLYALICMLTDTGGVRIKEALTITNEGVDFDNLVITVIGKGNKQRIVQMSLELRKVLYQYSQKHRYSRFPAELFFYSSTGTLLSYHNTYRDIGRVFKKCGISPAEFDGYFHMWRRKFAKSYVRNGGNLFYLQKTIGQTNIATTKLYVDVEPEDIKATHFKTFHYLG